MSVTLAGARASEPAAATLADLRKAIDALDDDILALIDQRLRLAERIGAAKKDPSAVKLKPDREAKVLSRHVARARPETRRVIAAVWRELMSAGLAAQGELSVVVWSGSRRDTREAARVRFGASASYREARTAGDALEAARTGDTVAVLALDPDVPWWSALPELEELWLFEAMGRRGPLDPSALAVGRISADSLARGVAFRVSVGGDSDMEGRRDRLLAVSEGRRLYACPETGSEALDRGRGFIGAAAPIA